MLMREPLDVVSDQVACVVASRALCDEDGACILRACMRDSLPSPLSEAVKAEVLRLDFPDRTGRPDMHEAHRMYFETVEASALSEDLKVKRALARY